MTARRCDGIAVGQFRYDGMPSCGREGDGMTASQKFLGGVHVCNGGMPSPEKICMGVPLCNGGMPSLIDGAARKDHIGPRNKKQETANSRDMNQPIR